MVIVALHDAARSGRTHIPYRNSVMTSVLRDSLGGNCVTSMVATLNPEAEHTDESLSTCRFAQRVARVTNVAVVNEEVEPQALIRILRARVGELEAEVAYLGHGEGGAAAGAAAPPDATLPADERDEIARAARAWVTSAASSAFPPAPLSLPRIKFALAALRDVARAALAEAAAVTSGSGGSALPVTPPRSRAEVVTADTAGDDGTGSGQADVMALRATVARLTEQLRTRDDELAAITSMVRATQLTLPTIDVGAPVVEAPPAGAENENSEARAPPAGDSRRRDPGSAPDNGRPPATSFRLPNGDTVDAAELESEAHALGVFTAAHPTREVRGTQTAKGCRNAGHAGMHCGVTLPAPAMRRNGRRRGPDRALRERPSPACPPHPAHRVCIASGAARAPPAARRCSTTAASACRSVTPPRPPPPPRSPTDARRRRGCERRSNAAASSSPSAASPRDACLRWTTGGAGAVAPRARRRCRR